MHDVFEVQKDHVYMIRGLMKSLNPKGVLYFSNNFRKFKMSEELINDYKIEDISLKTIPKDFRDLKIHHCFKITLK
jgi:23S rRNA G2069 N7-methylase RlmK/C1962 C5-methylase RlmI